jgi:hypothetical protein
MAFTGAAHPLRQKRRLAPARGGAEQGELAAWFRGKYPYQGGAIDELAADRRSDQFRGELNCQLAGSTYARRCVCTGVVCSWRSGRPLGLARRHPYLITAISTDIGFRLAALDAQTTRAITRVNRLAG